MKSVTAQLTALRKDITAMKQMTPHHSYQLGIAADCLENALEELRQPTSRYNLHSAGFRVGAAADALQRIRIKHLPDRAIAIQQQIRTTESLLFGVN